MSVKIVYLLFFIILIRFLSLLISIRNERYLKTIGSIEYDRDNTLFLTVSHVVYFVCCILEGYLKSVQFSFITIIGIILFIISCITLITVIIQLGKLWTFKLIIAKNHKLKESFIFKYLRHPNYFLNVIPELLATAFICKAWIVLFTLFPVHLIFLGRRVIQENRIMKQTFAGY